MTKNIQNVKLSARQQEKLERYSLTLSEINVGSQGGFISGVVTCPQGHTQLITKSTFKAYKGCRYCDRRRYTFETLREDAKKWQVQIEHSPYKESPTKMKEVLRGTKVTYSCEAGHRTTESLQELEMKGKNRFPKGACTLCNNTRNFVPFSRSEEIIATVLDHEGVIYEREYPVSRGSTKLYCDFYIPALGVVLEYDGSVHSYGGLGGRGKERTKELDALKDEIVESMGLEMVRIPFRYIGMRIVYFLKQKYFPHIDMVNGVYRDLVASIFDEASEAYGWSSWETNVYRANANLLLGRKEAKKLTGAAAGAQQRAIHIVYGLPVADIRGSDLWLEVKLPEG